ncbi:MAG TPA: hypothetical protein PK728_10810 [Bacillota bacterium]|nr:hypothetical protein [Bacillota bacterium]
MDTGKFAQFKFSAHLPSLKSVIRIRFDTGGQPAFFKTFRTHVDGTDTSATGAVQIEFNAVTAQRNPAFHTFNTGNPFVAKLAKHITTPSLVIHLFLL